MQDHNKTRGLLIDELNELRAKHEIATGLLRTAEYAFTKLPFDHASRRGVLVDIKRFLEGTPAPLRVLTDEDANNQDPRRV